MKIFQFKKGENSFKIKQENSSKRKITPSSHYIGYKTKNLFF